ncbi:MAG: hypothetical protein QOH19_1758 [Actinomycetota bacterium]|nr:hypothetical protein [Actinomycetota bacterium]
MSSMSLPAALASSRAACPLADGPATGITMSAPWSRKFWIGFTLPGRPRNRPAESGRTHRPARFPGMLRICYHAVAS